MKVKMKRCMSCKTLLSNSSKVCTKCGCNELEKVFYTDESKNYTITNKQIINKQITIIGDGRDYRRIESGEIVPKYNYYV